jgi:hypothetical protein
MAKDILLDEDTILKADNLCRLLLLAKSFNFFEFRRYLFAS